MIPATMKRSSSNEPSKTPPPQPQASRQSMLKLLSASTFLFPNAATDLYHGLDKFARPSSSGQLRPNNVSNAATFHCNPGKSKCTVLEFANDTNGKKSVRFRSDVTLCGLNPAPVPCGTSSEEKQLLWYGADDFDRFKRGAAQDAGVAIARSGKKEAAEESRRFVVAGDFDGRLHPAVDADSDGSDAPNGTAAEGARYNENEYGDSPDGDGGTVCRRGLGHHFSRSRRRSRAIARSAVAAWQQSLRAAVAGGDPGGDERVRLTLALVSARCSRTAREEARWRGDVDYRVAHPERHVDDAGAPLEKPLSKSSAEPLARAESDDGSPVERMAGKRDCAPCIVASYDGARRKRQRSAGGEASPADASCDGMLRLRAEAWLTPTPIGILRAEV